MLFFKGVRERSSCGSKPEVSPRNTRHERWHKSGHLSLLCIATHKPFAHTSVKNRYRIFIRPVPPHRICSYGNIPGHGFGSSAEFSGCRDRPMINFKTAVAEGKKRRHACSKTPASLAVWMLFRSCKPCFAAFTEAYKCLKFILSLAFLVLLWHDKRTKSKSFDEFYSFDYIPSTST